MQLCRIGSRLARLNVYIVRICLKMWPVWRRVTGHPSGCHLQGKRRLARQTALGKLGSEICGAGSRSKLHGPTGTARLGGGGGHIAVLRTGLTERRDVLGDEARRDNPAAFVDYWTGRVECPPIAPTNEVSWVLRDRAIAFFVLSRFKWCPFKWCPSRSVA